ncbi:MAG: phosphohistidine phosphatase SixA [Sulfolobaceae archaeon]|nr:phosphohistidine phosphatase SixA [Sulfolobaceae archaeon]
MVEKLLILVRHGDAESKGDDYSRKLTDKGIKQVELTASIIKNSGIMPKVVYSSPLVRAVQTAEIIVNNLGLKIEIKKVKELEANRDPNEFLKIIQDEKESPILAVGHDPFMTNLVKNLTGADVDFKKGGIAIIDLETKKLRVLLYPEFCEKSSQSS